MCVGSRVRLVGVSISFEKNFYQLPYTAPLYGSPYRSFRDNADIFAWTPSDMPGVPRELAVHSLDESKTAKPASRSCAAL
jgi:hypothetical protein